MKANKISLSLSITLGVIVFLFSYIVQASEVIEGNLLIQGNNCIGTDCTNNEVFLTVPLKLSENNARLILDAEGVLTEQVIFTDGSCYGSIDLGDSWNLNANSIKNGGSNYFEIAQSSVDKETLLSDGTATKYTCTSNIASENGVIDKGESCEEAICSGGSPTDKTELLSRSAVKFSENSTSIKDGGVALGFNAQVVDSTLAIGGTNNLTRLVNIKDPLIDADILNLSSLKIYYSKIIYLENLNSQLDALEEKLVLLESVDIDDNYSGGSFSYLFISVIGLLIFCRKHITKNL